MGLCLENVPLPFAARYVVPVSTQTDMALPIARISHLPNNYANDPRMPLGKVRIDELFKGARALAENRDWWPSREHGGDEGGRLATELTSMPSQNREVASNDRYYLISHHDTILFVDEAAQRFRHGPFGIAPLNLALELVGTQAHLILLGDDPSKDRKLSFAQPTGEIHFLSHSFDPNFQIDSFADGRIGLRMNELYVAADLDGLVRNDRSWCRAFEQFRLIRMDTLDGLTILQRHSWISHGDHQVVTLSPQPIDFGGNTHESSALAATLAPGAIELRRDIVFGPARMRLVGRAPQLVFDRTNDASPNDPLDVFITDVTGNRYGFSRLKS